MTAEADLHVSYDELPYGGRPVPSSHPDVLFVHAHLAGLSPADPREARVLEIGCAEGANLLPIAARYEGARCVGVDRGRRHIDAAIELRDRLGSTNLELIRADVMDWEPDGQFDYVLCHGVLSWVPDEVADRILALIRQALSPRGVAFVSYNVTAGWGIRDELRHALRRRARGAESAQVGLAHVRGLLSFLAGHPLENNLHAQLLAEEARGAAAHADAYLAHEYLSPDNRAFRFSEIAQRAEAHELAFIEELTSLGDASLADGVAGALGGLSEDRGEREDLLDLLYGRAFRMSLFAPKEAPRGPVGPGHARRLCFGAGVAPESKHPSFEPGDTEFFRGAGGVRIAAEDPWLKAALAELARATPGLLAFDDLVERAAALLRLRRVLDPDAEPSEEDRDRLGEDLLELHRLQHAVARPTPIAPPLEPSAAPRATTLARLCGRRLGFVTDPYHRALRVDAAQAAVLTLLDGSRDRSALVRELDARLQAAGIELDGEDGGELPPERREPFLTQYVERTLAVFARLGILEA